MKYPKDRNIHRPPHTFIPGAYYFVSARTYFALPYLREDRYKQILLESIEKAVGKFSLALFGWVILDHHYHLLLKLPDKDNKPKLFNLAEKRSNRLQPVSLGQAIGFIHGRSSRLLRELETQRAQSFPYDFTHQELSLLKNRFLKHLGEKYFLIEQGRIEKFKQLIDTGNTGGLDKFMRNVPKVWYQYLDHVIGNEADFYRHLNYIHQNPVKHSFCKDLLDYKFSSIHEYIKRYGKDWVGDCFRRYPIIDFQPSFEDW
jgi:REP element-mobilizing transposase RayT